MDEKTFRDCIVVGIDGSDHADAALGWAADQAGLERRPLLIVHSAPDARRDPVREQMVQDAVHLASTGRTGIDIRTLVAEDDPRETLITGSRSARLVVVGSHGRSRWRTALLGSVSAAVARHAACPVVVTKDVTRDSGLGVLVGADGTDASRPVIEFAFRQASLRQQALTVTHCFWDIAGELAHGRDVRPDEAGVDDLRMLLSASVAGLREDYPDVPVELTLSRGLVDVVLAKELPAHDLLVVGRHPASGPARLLYSSITAAVLEQGRGNVAVVPESPAASG
ncbi:universal stress protein [Nocardioides piscis]|uniref:Universal stress protein n=1 Tax=Nocardioides piscis TaxID=2714938 RepID=A0A6G7YJ65_9ACTN|nr:universal stress protein [Nocardioides piscis]QIK76779.1 universal stress protein [Nocardioides piscis]